MGLQKVKVENFRCLESVEFCPDARINVITGQNGAGKTSVLEAIFFLGRGRSFRAGEIQGLIRTGCEEFIVYGEISGQEEAHRLGIQVGRGVGRTIHVNGQGGGQVADLSTVLPVQVIDPGVNHLVQGGPAVRRQFIDWGVFHVKHTFLASWRRFRRALQQRNTALRQKANREAVRVWDTELIESGQRVDMYRREYLEEFEPVLSRVSSQLLGTRVSARYLPGWPADKGLEEALTTSLNRDVQFGVTHVGPHRAELALEIDGQTARNRLSRGQQKLLGIALVLGQSEFVAARMDRIVTLLVDEPAAELDNEHVKQLMDALNKPNLQLFVTALTDEALPLGGSPAMFHVKHGILSSLI